MRVSFLARPNEFINRFKHQGRSTSHTEPILAYQVGSCCLLKSKLYNRCNPEEASRGFEALFRCARLGGLGWFEVLAVYIDISSSNFVAVATLGSVLQTRSLLNIIPIMRFLNLQFYP